MQTSLRIRRPDDWHLHLRDDGLLRGVLPETSRHFARGLVMPNLLPAVTTAKRAEDYRRRILAALPEGHAFVPLMTLYLTDTTDPADVAAAHDDGLITAVKLYPAGATTNSGSGVRDIRMVMPVLERLAETGCPLCVHGEVADPDVDIFDREARFIETMLEPLARELPDIRIVLEHVTTREGVDFVRGGGESLAATVTVHHMMLNRNHVLAGGIRPHYYCLPVAKREEHRLAVRAAATSGDGKFFLGTDSAPHRTTDKLAPCGCAGIFTAPNAIPCLAQVFEDENALDRLEAFTSLNGARFYGLAPNSGGITLRKTSQPSRFPKAVDTPAGAVTVFDPVRPIYWSVD